MQHRESCAGFGLIDVLIALTIVAILATLAYPDYRAHLERGRRMDAITALIGVQVAQEQWRANHPEYADLSELNWVDAQSAQRHYRVRVPQRSAGGYLAVAEPREDGAQGNDRCGAFAVDQNGPVYEGYAEAGCWHR